MFGEWLARVNSRMTLIWSRFKHTPKSGKNGTKSRAGRGNFVPHLLMERKSEAKDFPPTGFMTRGGFEPSVSGMMAPNDKIRCRPAADTEGRVCRDELHDDKVSYAPVSTPLRLVLLRLVARLLLFQRPYPCTFRGQCCTRLQDGRLSKTERASPWSSSGF